MGHNLPAATLGNLCQCSHLVNELSTTFINQQEYHSRFNCCMLKMPVKSSYSLSLLQWTSIETVNTIQYNIIISFILRRIQIIRLFEQLFTFGSHLQISLCVDFPLIYYTTLCYIG